MFEALPLKSKKGDRVLIDDGRLLLRVEESDEEGGTLHGSGGRACFRPQGDQCAECPHRYAISQ